MKEIINEALKAYPFGWEYDPVSVDRVQELELANEHLYYAMHYTDLLRDYIADCIVERSEPKHIRLAELYETARHYFNSSIDTIFKEDEADA